MDMDLKAYFKEARGVGILATCDPSSMVDMAIYVRPAVIDEKTIAFVMRQRLSHQNLRTNLRAAYMFIEQAEPQYKGLRLYLTMLREETNTSVIEQMRRQQPWIYPDGDDSEKFLVLFNVDRIRPLVGEGYTA